MSTKSSVLELPKTGNMLQTIGLAGLVGGLLDATAGVIFYFLFMGMNPVQVLQFIAAGIYGKAAFDGGLTLAGIGVAGVGLVLHFFIAYVVTAIYFLAYPLIPFLSRYKVVAGLLFGVGIWLVMNLLILPNSNLPQGPANPVLKTIEIIWHAALVGLPIALIIARYYDAKAGR
jgi:uncharacterized membrane protein YagU involved in acid resistance